MKANRFVVVGASAGGVDALKYVLPSFKTPSDYAVMVVLHLPAKGPNLIPSLFESICDFKIKEAESGELCEAQTIYIAPPDYHLSLERDATLSLSNEPALNFSRPSIDVLFESAAFSQQDKITGVLLTGANQDGAKGIALIHKEGGTTLVQDPKSAEYPAMPQAALEIIKPTHILNLDQLKNFLSEIHKRPLP